MDFVKKNWFLVLVLLVAVLVLGYLGRHKIKAMLGVAPAAAPVTERIAPESTSSAMAPSDNIYTTKSDPAKGDYLADFNGMSLYVFDNDLPTGTSTCYDACATKWPPYTSGATTETNLPENVTVMTRSDGTKIFAYKDRPLYYYYLDQKAGDVTGDGVGGVWHLVKP